MVAWREHLIRDPAVCSGQLTVRGTRVLVANILDTLAENASPDEVLRHFPSLTRQHIEAALAYAAELARDEVLVPLKT